VKAFDCAQARRALVLLVAVTAACGPKTPPATRPVLPAAAAYPGLAIPADLNVSDTVRQQHDEAWRKFQTGDARGATREFTDILKTAPAFYPAETGLGYIALDAKQYRAAAAHFAAALRVSGTYMPALDGQVLAQLGAGDDLGAVAAIEALLAADPKREEMRSRLDVLRMRAVEGQLEAANKARSAGKLDEAQAILERAFQASASSGVLARELARVELIRKSLDEAEAHVRRAIELDAGDADALALLGDVLDAEGHAREAADAFTKALALDPQPQWREKRDALEGRAALEALPAEYRAIPSAPSVTRGEVAAMVGIELKAVIDRAPKRATDVITDIRSHWAAAWILPVSQAGVMDVLPNHTFQPNAIVKRADLAHVVSQLLTLIGSRRPADAAAWRNARPVLADVGPTHASYRAIAEAVAAGAMKADETGKFVPARPATGEELTAAVARLRQLAGR
jgi:tetratricopeptide (TPR) repeat protein